MELKKQTFNHCSLASKDPNREQQYLYAHGIRYKLQNKLIPEFDIKQELKQRPDYQEIMQILRELAG